MQEDPLSPALYVVATPIGNLGDITQRALDVLRRVALVAAEDTRVTQRLLRHFGIEQPLVALHRHNERTAAERIVSVIAAGHAVALTSDAGTPCLSDPGAALVAKVRATGATVVAIPGPSALVAAWSIAGMPGPGFLFHGFLPPRAGERQRVLQSLSACPYALVFYEAPHRVLETVEAMCEVFGEARGAVAARELTKLYEQVHAGTLGDLLTWLRADPNRRRGEFVLIVAATAPASDEQPGLGDAALRVLLQELPPAQAARLAARISGASRARLYELAHRLRAKA